MQFIVFVKCVYIVRAHGYDYARAIFKRGNKSAVSVYLDSRRIGTFPNKILRPIPFDIRFVFLVNVVKGVSLNNDIIGHVDLSVGHKHIRIFCIARFFYAQVRFLLCNDFVRRLVFGIVVNRYVHFTAVSLNCAPILRNVELELGVSIKFRICGDHAVGKTCYACKHAVAVLTRIRINGITLYVMVIKQRQFEYMTLGVLSLLLSNRNVRNGRSFVIDGKFKRKLVIVSVSIVAVAVFPVKITLHCKSVLGVVGKVEFAYIEIDFHIAARLLAARRMAFTCIVIDARPNKLARRAVAYFHIYALCAAEQARADHIEQIVAVGIGSKRRVLLLRGRLGISACGDKREFTHAPIAHAVNAARRSETGIRQSAVHVGAQFFFGKNRVVSFRFAYLIRGNVEHRRVRPVAVKSHVRDIKVYSVEVVTDKSYIALDKHAVFEVGIKIIFVLLRELDLYCYRRFAIAADGNRFVVYKRLTLDLSQCVSIDGVVKHVRFFGDRSAVARHAFRHYKLIEIIAQRALGRIDYVELQRIFARALGIVAQRKFGFIRSVHRKISLCIY